MGLAKKTMVLLFVLGFVGVSMGAVYKVGDSAGWTNIGHVDYKTWSATNNFHVGDTILFEYNKQFHDVVRVTHKNFKSCNATAPYSIFTTGDDAFTVKNSGHFFFICSLPGHCQAGQKVDIRVPAELPRPSPTPSPIPSPIPGPPPSGPGPFPLLPPLPSPSGPNVTVSHNSVSSLHKPKGLASSKLWLYVVALAFCFGIAY